MTRSIGAAGWTRPRLPAAPRSPLPLLPRLVSLRLVPPRLALPVLLACAGCATQPTSYVTLLQSPDGTTGKVFVNDAAGSRVLDRAGQATALDGSAAHTFDVTAAQLNRDFTRVIVAQPPLPETFAVNFLLSTVRMTPDSLREIPEIAARIRERPAPELVIVGHTDTVGERAFNERLGLARARAVAAALAEHGVAAVSVALETRGERELLVATPDETPEPRNRRAIVSVR